jgi:recombinational DNA repair protein RecR
MKHGKARIKGMCETHTRSKLCDICETKDEHKKHVVEMQEAHDILESLHTHMENLLEISRFKNYSPISYQRY